MTLAIWVVLALVAVGLIASQLLRLRRWLDRAPMPEEKEPPPGEPR
ncbi:hypothetical protein H7J77_18920 [Mycolicibacillus parakoreensis]|uniref:Uncharacterized protein n=1 Tax=Mycolicibacillus parakoreensis TaxID=1069221 RepID=A0ABY3U6E1_9MYCO|nr:hypothetical protein [Mycolicibacillus parakoreensis]MCV7317604.1 hypothetical protein [Mycolicibacillus parakoreensis]ULN54307.1 hypothetical protein MIU77_08690 [Mycolicibacillus parakoreensis]HLS00221.1 hypothetical protein [Mycolicibacillus parakoreensis]